jgi:diguanylate cyclase (GGDEF)-like protein
VTSAARRALVGVVLGAGAPVGWLAIRWIGGRTPFAELSATPGLYAYLAIATSLVFAAFGWRLGVLEDRLVAANAELARLARVDSLTGLANARVFSEALPRLTSHARRTRTPIAVIVLDVDLFKRVNDSFGHAAGDRVLREVGGVLGSGRRREDLVARTGGEEFAVVLPGVDRAGAERVADRIRRAVAAAGVTVGGTPVHVTISAGVAELDPAESDESFVARADAALYESKRAGRDRVSAAPPRAATSLSPAPSLRLG